MPESTPIKPIIEAALLAAGQPLSIVQLCTLFGEEAAPPREEVEQALAELTRDCEGRGVELVEVASGFRYQVRASAHRVVAHLWTERQTKYSRALLETLALIAYRQPITRAEIEQVRGVGIASSIVKTLEERDWVRVLGHRDVPGKPALLGTTRAFLDYFGLKSLDQLPPLHEIGAIDDPLPELPLEDVPGATGPLATAMAGEPGDGGDGEGPRASPAASRQALQ